MFFNGIIRNLVISKFALRTNWRFSTILKTNNKSLRSNVLWYVKVYIFWKFIQYTIHWDKTQKKFLSGKTNATKMHSFFFHEHQPITVLLLIRNSYTSWNTWFIPLKLCVGFSIFDSVSFLLKFMSLFNKMHGLFHRIEIIEKTHTDLFPDLWGLSWKKNFENSNFQNFESFESVTFSQ